LCLDVEFGEGIALPNYFLTAPADIIGRYDRQAATAVAECKNITPPPPNIFNERDRGWRGGAGGSC